MTFEQPVPDIPVMNYGLIDLLDKPYEGSYRDKKLINPEINHSKLLRNYIDYKPDINEPKTPFLYENYTEEYDISPSSYPSERSYIKDTLYDNSLIPNESPKRRLTEDYIQYYEDKQNLQNPNLRLGSLISNVVSLNVLQAPKTQKNQLYNLLPGSLFTGNPTTTPYDFLARERLTPEDLPRLAVPILAFMERVKPHIVIGCDRGGRLFSLAVHAAWQHTRPGQPFPTIDSKIHFARISKVEDADVLQQKIDEIVAASKEVGAQRGKTVPDGEQLRVMFLDDWVIGGGTKKLTDLLMKKHGARSYFAVMCGDGADVSGQSGRVTNVSWHDKTGEIGVNYISSMQQDTDGTISQALQPVPVRSFGATHNRNLIHSAARALTAAQVSSGSSVFA